jgi:hypothetical protein
MYVGTHAACTTCVRQQEYSHQCRCMQHQWESDLYSSDRHPHTHIYIYMYMYTYNRCSNKVSDIQGSICRISSQACAGESSRSGTANVLRNALIWKSRSSTLLYEKPSPQIQTPYCTTMALVDTTAQDSGENLSARLSQSC